MILGVWVEEIKKRLKLLWEILTKPKEETMEEKPLYSLKGVGGQLEVYHEKLIIKHEGFFASFLSSHRGDKKIYYKNISSVQVKAAGLLNGYIQFSLNSGYESVSGVFEATQDENSLIFQPKSNELVKEIQSYIEKAIHDSQKSADAPVSIADEIGKLKKLFDEGAINQEEFEAQKKKLLG